MITLVTGHAQTNITLPPPIAGTFEDFSSIDEGGDLSAKGWTVTNFTTETNPEPNLDDPSSASYEDWVVISRERLLSIGWDSSRRLQVAPGQVINGTPVTELLQGKFLYAESDVRSGSQVQYIESPNFNCSSQLGVTLVFHSAYEQNQDNLGGVEYSVDNGANWLPVAYFIDGPDIVRDEQGNIDAEATLNASHGDVATYTDEEGNFFGGTYGSFLKAPISQDLAPYIQARINDNSIESKRVEVYRLPEADNKATVRLRFIHAGTASWYWGIDDFGVYSESSPPPPSDLRLTSVRHLAAPVGGSAAVELKWTSVAGRRYTVQSSTTLTAWPVLQADIAATGSETTYTHSNLPAGEAVRFYRVVEQP